MTPRLTHLHLSAITPKGIALMKAVLCKAFGPAESLVLEEIAGPEPKKNEIVLDVPLNDNLPALIAECAEIMDITPPGHAIPMMAEFSFGPNWYNQFELGERPCEKQVEEALSALFTPKEKKDAA